VNTTTIATRLIDSTLVADMLLDLTNIEDEYSTKAVEWFTIWDEIDHEITMITLPTEIVTKYAARLIANVPNYQNRLVIKSVLRLNELIDAEPPAEEVPAKSK